MAWRTPPPPRELFNWNRPAVEINFPKKLINEPNQEPFTFENYTSNKNYIEVSIGNHKWYYNKNAFRMFAHGRFRNGLRLFNPAGRQNINLTNLRIVKFRNKNAPKINTVRAMAQHWRGKAERAHKKRERELMLRLWRAEGEPTSRFGRLRNSFYRTVGGPKYNTPLGRREAMNRAHKRMANMAWATAGLVNRARRYRPGNGGVYI